MEQLYVEVLYTIRHKLGAHSAQYPHHYKEDLALYAQQAFGVGQDFHYRCHAIASEEKVNPRFIVLFKKKKIVLKFVYFDDDVTASDCGPQCDGD